MSTQIKTLGRQIYNLKTKVQNEHNQDLFYVGKEIILRPYLRAMPPPTHIFGLLLNLYFLGPSLTGRNCCLNLKWKAGNYYQTRASGHVRENESSTFKAKVWDLRFVLLTSYQALCSCLFVSFFRNCKPAKRFCWTGGNAAAIVILGEKRRYDFPPNPLWRESH